MKDIASYLTNRLYLLVVVVVSLSIMVMGELFYDLNTVVFTVALAFFIWTLWQEYKATGSVDVTSLLTSTDEDHPAGDTEGTHAEG